MQKIKDFWINSYKSDKIAFTFEWIRFIFTVTASLTLAFNARDPKHVGNLPASFLLGLPSDVTSSST